MKLETMPAGDYKKAMKLAARIKEIADDLESEIYHLEKEYKSLGSKKR